MAVNYSFPNWIRPPDIAAEYQRGVAIGQQAAQESQRLQMQQEENQRAHLMEQQRLQVDKAYKDQQLAMQKQELDQATQLNAIKVNESARALDARNKYQQFIQGGGDPAEGLLRFGPTMDAGSLAGLAAIVRQSESAKHPFVPSEMTTTGGTRMVQLSPGRYQIAPQTQAGPVQGQSILDASGKPISGIVGLPGPKGMEYRNIPQANTRRIEKAMQKIEDSWPDLDIEGTEVPKSDIAKAAFLLDQKRYKALKTELDSGSAPAKKNRVKVKGPNGQSGTIEEGDKLPEGWSVVQ